MVFNSVKRLFAIIGGSRSKERAVGGERKKKKTRALSKMHEVNKWTENPGFKKITHTKRKVK